MIFLLLLAYLVLIILLINLAFIGICILARPILNPNKRQSWSQLDERTFRLLRRVAVTLCLLLVLHPLYGLQRRSQHRAYFEHECRFDGYPRKRKEEFYENGGGFFTGEYVYEFNAPYAEIEAWIERSSIFEDADTQKTGREVTYSIQPRRAISCLIKIDYEEGHVRIDSAWS